MEKRLTRNISKKQTSEKAKESGLEIGGIPFEDVLSDLLKVKPAKDQAGSKTAKKKSAKKAK